MEFGEKACQAIKAISILSDSWIQYYLYKYSKGNIQRSEEDINGKCIVITGGTTGIGRESAKEFARRGATVVIGDVDFENGKNTVEEIQRDTGNMNVTILKLDLSDMDSVEQFAQKVRADYPKIKILLNNAGIGGSSDENIKTKDGFNIHVAVNFMGHFLLTHLLMDNLKAEKNPRIVSISSTFQLLSKLNIDDLNMDESGFGLQNCFPYSNTKFMLALFTKQLEHESGVNAYAICPGLVKTKIHNSASPFTLFLFKLFWLVTVSPREAASKFIMYCALERSIKNESGKMYRFRKHFDKANKRLDSDLAKKLCEKSATLVGLNERLARVKNKILKVK